MSGGFSRRNAYSKGALEVGSTRGESMREEIRIRCARCARTYPPSAPVWRCDCGEALDLVGGAPRSPVPGARGPAR
jgi:hypothetical protein